MIDVELSSSDYLLWKMFFFAQRRECFEKISHFFHVWRNSIPKLRVCNKIKIPLTSLIFLSQFGRFLSAANLTPRWRKKLPFWMYEKFYRFRKIEKRLSTYDNSQYMIIWNLIDTWIKGLRKVFWISERLSLNTGNKHQRVKYK